jgi:UDP-glucose 4-epimerase
VKVLITGATGQMGNRVLPKLASEHEVIALSRGEASSESDSGVTWIHQDLTEPLDRRALPGQVDCIVHLAQSQRYREFPEGAADVFAVNVASTSRLLEYARESGAESFVLASTGGVYAPGPEPIDEEAQLAPASPYLRSKRMAELLVETYAGLLHTTMLRFFFVYGPGSAQTLVARLAKQILADEVIDIDGDPGLKMNPIFVEDAASAVAAALGLRGHSVVNVAGSEVVSVTELIQRLGSALNLEPRLRHSEGDPGDLVADTGLLRSELGFTPGHGLDEGLASVAESLGSRTRA